MSPPLNLTPTPSSVASITAPYAGTLQTIPEDYQDSIIPTPLPIRQTPLLPKLTENKHYTSAIKALNDAHSLPYTSTPSAKVLLRSFLFVNIQLSDLHSTYDVDLFDFLTQLLQFLKFQKNLILDEPESTTTTDYVSDKPLAIDDNAILLYFQLTRQINEADVTLHLSEIGAKLPLASLQSAQRNLRNAIETFASILSDSRAYLDSFFFAGFTLLHNQIYLLSIDIDPTIAAVPGDTTASLVAVHALKLEVKLKSSPSKQRIIGTADSAADINCIDEVEALRLQLQFRPLRPTDPTV